METRLPLVVVVVPLSESAAEELGRRCEVVVPGPEQMSGPGKERSRVEGVLVGSGTRVDECLLDSFPRLRAVSTRSIGVDHIDLRAAKRRGIVVAHAANRSDALAEIVLALMLTLARKLGEARNAVMQGRWAEAPVGHDLRGKKLFIVGFGRTGRAVCAAARVLGMAVSFFDKRADVETPVGVRREESLASGLAGADWVTLHVDLNSSTLRLIDSDAIALMKPEAYLINTSRGAVVDQAALTSALRDRRIAGAGLDVLDLEPPDRNDPLLCLSNVVITPHIGFATREVMDDMSECAVRNLVACLYKEPCEYVVSMEG